MKCKDMYLFIPICSGAYGKCMADPLLNIFYTLPFVICTVMYTQGFPLFWGKHCIHIFGSVHMYVWASFHADLPFIGI